VKKGVVLLIILVANIVAGNAQFFVEEITEISYNSHKNSVDGVSHTGPSNFSIGIKPKVGYYLNEHIAMGVNPSFYYSVSKMMISDPDNPDRRIEYKELLPFWQFSVFGRYKLWGFGRYNPLWGTDKVSLLLESSIGLGGAIQKEKTALKTEKKSTSSQFIISVSPTISYDFNKKISLIIQCNFLNLKYQYAKTKQVNDGVSRKISDFRVGLSDKASFFNIGGIYNF